MKNVIVAGVAALALVGCGAKEEVAVEAEAAPAVEAVAPAEGEVVEAAPANDAVPEGVDSSNTAIP